MTIDDDDWCCEDCRLATDPKTGCMRAGYCRYRDGPPDLGPSDMPCREAMLPNYLTYKPGKRGEPTLLHEWFYRKAHEDSPRWHACDPLVCRECNRRRRVEACADPEPMA